MHAGHFQVLRQYCMQKKSQSLDIDVLMKGGNQTWISWGPCKDIHDINVFLGAIGVCRMFIKKFSRLMEPLNRLKKKEVKFEFREEQEQSMQALNTPHYPHLLSCLLTMI